MLIFLGGTQVAEAIAGVTYSLTEKGTVSLSDSPDTIAGQLKQQKLKRESLKRSIDNTEQSINKVRTLMGENLQKPENEVTLQAVLKMEKSLENDRDEHVRTQTTISVLEQLQAERK